MDIQNQIDIAANNFVGIEYSYLVINQPINDSFFVVIKNNKKLTTLLISYLELTKPKQEVDDLLRVKIKNAIYMLDKTQ